ncbi:MATH domain-containing protein [Ditylenchus destructor]|uniref:MATH domain-containing protein n=1 Tax=Ditylenchus destructor TaxID=166010 RepID=A0AAD4QRE2_9BILA|nr:MATH domain-containing protein [Ditylenchus destructor]
MSEEGTIELRIERFSEFVQDDRQRWSAPAYIYGLSWEISALAFPNKALGVYLHCNEEDDDPNWSCQASFELRVVSQKTGVDDRVRQFVKTFSSNKTVHEDDDFINCDEMVEIDHGGLFVNTFSSDETVYGDEDFISCDVLLDPENGFIKDDVVILRARVKAEVPQSAE